MENTQTVLVVMVAITGALVLVQFVVLLAMYFTMRKALRGASEYAAELRATVGPVIRSSQDVLQSTKQILTKLEPKLDAAATDLAEMTKGARGQMAKFEASVDEITQRVRGQAARIDGMATSTLNGVDRAAKFLNTAVSVPVRQVSGIMAAAKAIIETLRAPTSPRRAAGPEPVQAARSTEKSKVTA